MGQGIRLLRIAGRRASGFWRQRRLSCLGARGYMFLSRRTSIEEGAFFISRWELYDMWSSILLELKGPFVSFSVPFSSNHHVIHSSLLVIYEYTSRYRTTAHHVASKLSELASNTSLNYRENNNFNLTCHRRNQEPQRRAKPPNRALAWFSIECMTNIRNWISCFMKRTS